MRFCVEFSVEKNKIPKDKNRLFLSIFKNCFNSFDQDYYNYLYEKKVNKIKNFTFSLYLGNCEFLRDEIFIPDKKIKLFYSAYDQKDGIMFYNSILQNIGNKFSINNNVMKVENIRLIKEKNIFDNQVVFKTLSPIVVREHMGDNKKTWYHSLNKKIGQEVFQENLQFQLIKAFGDKVIFDFKDLDFELIKNKEVKVKNYGIEVLSNISKIKVEGKPYILDYLYKAGIGSKRGSGFGMVNII